MPFELFREDPQELPPSARLISLILQGAGVEDFEPRILAQLYEVAHSHIVNVLQDAQIFAEHAGHKDLTASDIRLAIETRTTTEFAHPPSKQSLVALANKKNSIPLPLVPEKFGLRLPPERHCVIKQNISIIPRKRKVEAVPVPQPVPTISPQTQMQIPTTVSSKIADEDDYDMDGKYC